MIYRKASYYDAFHCLAGQCPENCCSNWQIVIDEESLKRYESLSGDFGNRVKNSVDWKEGIFYQYEKRCAFLNEENLCELHLEGGSQALCKTCEAYPRHVEEFDEVREYTLSLSCPEAARIMLTWEEKTVFLEEETQEEELEDFEDFDYLFQLHLESARNLMMSMMQERSMDPGLRMGAVLELARQLQSRLDQDSVLAMEDVIGVWEKQYRSDAWIEENKSRKITASYQERIKEWPIFEDLEILYDVWHQRVIHIEEQIYQKGEPFYWDLVQKFQAEWGSESPHKRQWELWKEQLFCFFLMTYFCGAVYDGMVESKIRFSIFSVSWIEEMVLLRWYQEPENFGIHVMIQEAYRYAREIEHNDENLLYLEERV